MAQAFVCMKILESTPWESHLPMLSIAFDPSQEPLNVLLALPQL